MRTKFDNLLYRFSLLLFLLPVGCLTMRNQAATPAVKAPVAVVHQQNAAPESKADITNSFIQQLLSKISLANLQIRKQRQQLINLFHQQQQHVAFSKKQQQWLKQRQHEYGIKTKNTAQKSFWETMLKRVNIVPTSLALAQAAQETGWGRSRFAKIANNYFGQWCYRKGCGLVPSKRPKGTYHEVQKFSSILASVKRYMLNLNTHHAYRDFRNLRQQRVNAKQPLTGLSLVNGIAHYNPSRQKYVKTIRSIIVHHKLYQFDE